MDILKFLGIDLNEKPEFVFSPAKEAVEISDGSLCNLLVTNIELPRNATSPKEGLVVNFLIYENVTEEKKYIVYENSSVSFPYGKKGLYVNHRVTPDTFSRMNYIVRVNNSSYVIKLPEDFDTYDEVKATKFFLAVVSYRFGLDRYISKGMIIPAFVYTTKKGYKDISIYDRATKSYLQTPVEYSFIGPDQATSEAIVDLIVAVYTGNGENNFVPSSSALDKFLR